VGMSDTGLHPHTVVWLHAVFVSGAAESQPSRKGLEVKTRAQQSRADVSSMSMLLIVARESVKLPPEPIRLHHNQSDSTRTNQILTQPIRFHQNQSDSTTINQIPTEPIRFHHNQSEQDSGTAVPYFSSQKPNLEY